jgi:hypothetical protein
MYLKQSGDELPPRPLPAIEYTVPADGFVSLTATCIHKKNEQGLNVFGMAYAKDSGVLFAFGTASVQVNPAVGINIVENSATIPVQGGGTFMFLGGVIDQTVYASYRRYQA